MEMVMDKEMEMDTETETTTETGGLSGMEEYEEPVKFMSARLATRFTQISRRPSLLMVSRLRWISPRVTLLCKVPLRVDYLLE